MRFILSPSFIRAGLIAPSIPAMVTNRTSVDRGMIEARKIPPSGVSLSIGDLDRPMATTQDIGESISEKIANKRIVFVSDYA